MAPRLTGLWRHFALTLRLNFRSAQAIVYGYAVPILFLLGFASVFRADSPPLLPQMGQLVTITILGGACFGFPTALVAERERGVWRRYRLLPVPIGGLVAGALAARLVIVAGAVLLQVLLARLFYGTPFPAHPAQAGLAFVVVTACFLGLGLLVAALADNVPAVQAMGQCLFLPMILIGGVGVPLAVLPRWAQQFAGFLPGRYAVQALQPCFDGPRGLEGTGFSLAALVVIGLAAGLAGARLFRWDAARHVGRSAGLWIAAGLSSWIAVGVAAACTGRLEFAPPAGHYLAVPDRLIETIDYSGLPADTDLATRLAPPFDGATRERMAGFAARLRAWGPGRLDDAGQSVRNLVCVATIADVRENPQEGEIARAVYDDLRANFPPDQLRRALAWIILDPNEGTVITAAPELGVGSLPDDALVRDRSALWAKKYLGRVLGKIRDP